MRVLAIDPGNVQSAFVVWDGKTIQSKQIYPNKLMLSFLPAFDVDVFLIEMVASYGMPVGKEVFETVLWIGRFLQEISIKHNKEAVLIYRKDVKMHHCHSMRAKDSNIHQALVDKYGDKGTKNNPGLTYGLSKDMWSAFAIATYWTERSGVELPSSRRWQLKGDPTSRHG